MDPTNFNATLLAQIFHFVVILVLLRLVAYKPLMKLLEERQKYVASNIDAAEQEKTEAEKLKSQFEAELKNAREQYQEMIQRATKEGEEQSQLIIAAAKGEATRIKDNAMQEIQREKEKAIAEVREQVASLSILVAEKVINQTIDADIQNRLINDFIEEAGGLPC